MEKSIIIKVSKLLKKAQSAQEIGSVEEAEIFAAKVNELLIKHNLSMSEVESTDEESPIEQSKEFHEINYGEKKDEGLWEIDLASVIAKFNFSETIYQGGRWVGWDGTKYYPKINFIGKKENIEICIFLFEFLRRTFSNLAPLEYNKKLNRVRDELAIFVKDDKNEAVLHFFYKYMMKIEPADIIVDYTYPKDAAGKRKFVLKDPAKLQLLHGRSIWIRSFLLGTCRGLREKFESEKYKFTPTDQEKITTLVKVEGAKVAKYVKEVVKPKGTISSNQGGGLSGEAIARGKEVGRNIKIGKGVTASSQQQTKSLQ